MIKAFELGMAVGTEGLSRLSARSKLIGQRIMGDVRVPYYTARLWDGESGQRITDEHEFPDKMYLIEGDTDPAITWRPKTFVHRAVLEAPRGSLHIETANGEKLTRPAAAFMIGNWALATPLDIDPQAGEPTDPVQVAFGQGGGDAWMALGGLDLRHRRFIPMTDVENRGDFYEAAELRGQFPDAIWV